VLFAQVGVCFFPRLATKKNQTYGSLSSFTTTVWRIIISHKSRNKKKSFIGAQVFIFETLFVSSTIFNIPPKFEPSYRSPKFHLSKL